MPRAADVSSHICISVPLVESVWDLRQLLRRDARQSSAVSFISDQKFEVTMNQSGRSVQPGGEQQLSLHRLPLRISRCVALLQVVGGQISGSLSKKHLLVYKGLFRQCRESQNTGVLLVQIDAGAPQRRSVRYHKSQVERDSSSGHTGKRKDVTSNHTHFRHCVSSCH